MTRIGTILTMAGFGSVILMLMNAHFVLLAWADPMQPAFGIVVGIAGVIVLIAGIVRERQAAPPPSWVRCPEAGSSADRRRRPSVRHGLLLLTFAGR